MASDPPLVLTALQHASPSSRSFLSLPPEIRNVIYELLLVASSFSPTGGPVSRCPFDWAVSIHPALLYTCRQIYREATPILYTKNTFSASPTLLTAMPFLIYPTRRVITPLASKLIKRWRVVIRMDCDPWFDEQTVTDAFTGADELEVEAREAMFRASGKDNLLLFKSVRGVRKAVVSGSVQPEFAEWLEQSMMADVGQTVEPFSEELMAEYSVWTHGNR